MKYSYIEELAKRRPELAGLICDIEKVCDLIIHAYSKRCKVIVCGNGGSCSDAGHIVGELMKGFHKKRQLSDDYKGKLTQYGGVDLAAKLQTPLRAIDLTAMSALNTATANDIDANYIYAQQVVGLADPGDIFFGISSSGNSCNVHYAAIAAKAAGAVLIGLTGAIGGNMYGSGLYDVIIRVPECITYRIQEEHISVYHAVCATVEAVFFID